MKGVASCQYAGERKTEGHGFSRAAANGRSGGFAAEVKAWLFRGLNGETESLISQRYKEPSSLSRSFEVARKFNSGD